MGNKMKSAKVFGEGGKKQIFSLKIVYFLIFLFFICLGIERAGATVPSQYILSDKAIKMGNTTPLKIFNLGTPEESTDAATKQYVDSIATGTGSIGLWMSNGANIYNNNSGNVGIGSTIPSVKLDVAGDIRSKGISSFVVNTQNEGIAILYPETANTYTRIGPTGFSPSIASSADDLAVVGKLEVGGIGYFNYNLGIGTTEPTHHLEVIEKNDGYGDWSHGVLPFQPAGVFIQASNVNSAGLYGEGFTRGVWGVARANGGSGYGILGEMGSGGCSWDNSTATGGAIVGVTNCSSGNSGVAIRATVLTDVEGYGIYSQGNLSKNYFEGNIGIGSTLPATKLDVNSNIQAGAYYDRDDANYFINPGVGGTGWGLYSNGSVYASGTDKNYFAGNVGIGTANPGVYTALQVNGRMTLSTNKELLLMANANYSTNGDMYMADGYAGRLYFKSDGSWRIQTASSGTAGATVSAYTSNLTIANTGKVGIGTTAPNSTLHINGSFTRAIITKTSTYTATASDDIILCDASGGGFVITLPTAVGIAGREYTIKKIDSSANQCGYTTTSGQTIDGAAMTYQLGTQWQTRTMVSDGANWIRLSNI
ncbi:MAG: hypothetical protein PHG83_01815 [Patescibacteria group bacterium]|nr:hypothetical protein [Patescibacteria group bacterium]